MSATDGAYYIPSAIDKTVAEVIVNQLSSLDLEEALVSDSVRDLSMRNSQIGWIPTDHWISGMMSHFVHHANNEHYNYDIFAWADPIQYTVYDGGDTHYKWHIDHRRSQFYKEKNLIRKLSISLCLTSDYTGGELQVLGGANRVMDTYPMKCGDILIFPSDAIHRVRKVKTGKRISLVGWFGGPKWK